MKKYQIVNNTDMQVDFGLNGKPVRIQKNTTVVLEMNPTQAQFLARNFMQLKITLADEANPTPVQQEAPQPPRKESRSTPVVPAQTQVAKAAAAQGRATAVVKPRLTRL